MNTVGTKKALLVYTLADGKCLNCRVPIAFKQFQIDHITAQQTYLENGEAIDTRLANLACLCKSCNSEKQDKGLEFYNENAKAFINRVKLWAKDANDIRKVLKVTFKSYDNNTVNADVMNVLCDNYALENPSSKFARIHRNGIFWMPIN